MFAVAVPIHADETEPAQWLSADQASQDIRTPGEPPSVTENLGANEPGREVSTMNTDCSSATGSSSSYLHSLLIDKESPIFGIKWGDSFFLDVPLNNGNQGPSKL